MIRLYILLLLFISNGFGLSAQIVDDKDIPAAYEVETTAWDEFNIWNFQSGDTVYVFADNAYVRDAPTTSGTLIDSLQLGHQVRITAQSFVSSKVKGYDAPWVMINYRKNNMEQTGYIWIGMLALKTNTTQNGIRFVYGLNRYRRDENLDGDGEYLMSLKLIDKQNHLIQSADYRIIDYGQSYITAAISDGKGLENVKNIVEFHFSGEACGIPSDSRAYAWTGEKLIELPSTQSISDAGVFYYSETLVFPDSTSKNKHAILKMFESGENLEENLDGEFDYTIKKKWSEEYLWNGQSVIAKNTQE